MIILATGFPRSGTRWLANAFERNGLDVGHEKWHTNGGVGYMFSGKEGYSKLLEADAVIHLVRDPRRAIASAMKNLNTTSQLAGSFGKDWQQAWLYWNKMAEATLLQAENLGKKTRFIRIEHSVPQVHELLLEAGIEIESEDMILPPPDHNHRQDYRPLHWCSLGLAVANMAVDYGYTASPLLERN